MAENGFIRDMLDVKVLILYILKEAAEPLDEQKLWELCYVDDRLTYFDVCQAIPELVASGHLARQEDGTVLLTARGEENIAITEDSLAFTVRMQAKQAVENYLLQKEKQSRVTTELREEGESIFVRGTFTGTNGPLFSMELAAPNKKQARVLEKALAANLERLYGAVMEDLMEEMEK